MSITKIRNLEAMTRPALAHISAMREVVREVLLSGEVNPEKSRIRHMFRGGAWFLSTPKGMNYFKALFDRGQDPERKEWASWQMPTVANPFIAPDEIESARLDMTEAAFNQEYLALFVNREGSVFRRVGEAATVDRTRPASRA